MSDTKHQIFITVINISIIWDRYFPRSCDVMAIMCTFIHSFIILFIYIYLQYIVFIGRIREML